MEWNDRFMMLFRDAVERYHLHPQTAAERFFLPEELEFLTGIGSGAAEMYAYVREYATLGEPSPSTALLIAAARRSFFMTQLRGISGAQPLRAKDLPAESEAFQEIPYLPHIIRKAAAKLHGTLDPAIMYYNEKDRQFLREHGDIPPADFLYLTWSARGDNQKIVMHVLNAMRGKSPQADEAATKPATAAPEPSPSAPATPAPAAPAQQELPLS